MKQNEINEIIAEFMGGPYPGDSINCGMGDKIIPEIEQQIINHYIDSLDAIARVWEKIDKYYLELRFFTPYAVVRESLSGHFVLADTAETPQIAAAISTARIILRLKDES